MKIQTTALAVLSALGIVTSEVHKPRRNLRRGDAGFKTKSKSRNAQSIFFPSSGTSATAPKAPTTPPRPAQKNVVFLLVDDVSSERFPETGNAALKGKLPGFTELKEDGMIFYPYHYSSSSICAPAQAGLFAAMEPGNLGAHQQFASNEYAGKRNYKPVPPPEVQFIPEKLRGMGYYTTGGGKLDYQVADVIPTFYTKILGGTYTNINGYMEQAWTPAIEMGVPFLTVLNMMDNHENLSTMKRENPIELTDSLTQEPPDLPNGKFGYATDQNLNFRVKLGEEPEFAKVANLDGFWDNNIDITGYNGDFDETTLNQADESLPDYVPEEIGIQSLWAREYDLLRNVDWRIGQVVKRLKEEGIYDDTAIFIFGDHGSAHYKGKTMIQIQSTRAPLWVKLPKDVPLSPSIVKGADGYNEDPRLMAMKDTYPTLMSILGIEPEPWMEGVAKAGMYEDVDFEYDALFSMVARESTIQGWKSFAAYNKEFYYQYHTLTMEAIEAREATGLSTAAEIADAKHDSLYANRYAAFKSPTFARLKRLMYINAENSAYPDQYRFLCADDARPPSEVLFDLRTDKYARTNLLREYIYTPVYGTTMQTWGNFVEKVTLDYGPQDLSRLDDYQLENYNSLKSALMEWIDGLNYVTSELDWDDGLYGEENKMALQFWPDGTQPPTADIEMDEETGELSCESEGAVFRYSVNSLEERTECESLGPTAKDEIEVMTPYDSGLPVIDYVSARNGRSYKGYLYDDASGRGLTTTYFLGALTDCKIFVSEDGTFMEGDCPSFDAFAFDTRDGQWNDETQTWDGVDPDTGEWLIDPVTVFDEETSEWNFESLGPYIFGPKRDRVYTGLNDDGTPFVSDRPQDTPMNRPGKPAPKYWVTDEDVTKNPAVKPSVSFEFLGWQLIRGEFTAENDPPELNTNTKGSYAWTIETRFTSITNKSNFEFGFSSFNYECLFWLVGTTVPLDFSAGDPNLYVFAQAIRKGFSDGAFKEIVLSPPVQPTV